MVIELFNFQYSAYGRIVKIVLEEKGIAYETREVNPFNMDDTNDYLNIHPFKRVPAIRHGDFVLYETAAISHYLDENFGGLTMKPSEIKQRARMRQIIGLIDNYGYFPLVRKVFSQRVFRPAFGETPDEEVIGDGLKESARALAALEKLVSNDGYIAGSSFSLADAHTIPMIDYFTMAPEGIEMLPNYPKLSEWWNRVKERPATFSTRPLLPT
ncbi:MAG: glutathione S-transferase family protein [Sneathiella sp.]|nr:glutathione S-transferase family protein [Sneathiella sp.]